MDRQLTRLATKAFEAKHARMKAAAGVGERAVPDVHVAIADARPGWKLAPNFNGYVPDAHNTEACEICQKPYDERQDIGD